MNLPVIIFINVLIVLASTFIASLLKGLFSKTNCKICTVLWGLYFSLIGLLFLYFSYTVPKTEYRLDLRSAAIILCVMYGGNVSGIITVGIIIAMRFVFPYSTATLLAAIINVLLYYIVILIINKIKIKSVYKSLLISLSISLIIYLSLLISSNASFLFISLMLPFMFLIIWFSLFLSTYFIKHVNTIEILMKQYRNKAEIDSLTGLFRYGAFIERLEKTYKENNIFSLVMLDIDDLKKINDNYGHLVGNDAITYIARTLIDCIGLNGTIGRVGGDEFSIILPKYSSKEAHDLCDEIIKSLKTGQKEVFNNLEVEISVSMGISSFPQDSRDLSELINIADTLLYSSKKNGKNKVSHSDSNL